MESVTSNFAVHYRPAEGQRVEICVERILEDGEGCDLETELAVFTDLEGRRFSNFSSLNINESCSDPIIKVLSSRCRERVRRVRTLSPRRGRTQNRTMTRERTQTRTMTRTGSGMDPMLELCIDSYILCDSCDQVNRKRSILRERRAKGSKTKTSKKGKSKMGKSSMETSRMAASNKEISRTNTSRTGTSRMRTGISGGTGSVPDILLGDIQGASFQIIGKEYRVRRIRARRARSRTQTRTQSPSRTQSRTRSLRARDVEFFCGSALVVEGFVCGE